MESINASFVYFAASYFAIDKNDNILIQFHS